MVIGDSEKQSTDRKARDAVVAAERGPDMQDTVPSPYQEDEREPREPEIPEPHASKSNSDEDTKPPKETHNPPLPNEPVPPPLPDEPMPGHTAAPDDGWEPVWDQNQHAFYFFNRITGVTQWENPRVPASAPAKITAAAHPVDAPARLHGGYNPAIHGDYDPAAPYALEAKAAEERATAAAAVAAQPTILGRSNEADYSAVGKFNRFTGRWQAAEIDPENHNDEAKSMRQMSNYFDVDAAANSHQGRSLKAERSGMKLSKAELKVFKEKRRERKEEKRRAWLMD